MTKREEILQEAIKQVTGTRVQDHGTPEDSFGMTAALWSAYFGQEFSPKDVALMLGLLKVARCKAGGGSGDSFVDLAGYAACAGEMNALKEKSKTISNLERKYK